MVLISPSKKTYFPNQLRLYAWTTVMCPTTSHSLTISTDDWLSLGHLVILSDFCGCFVFCAAADFNNCFITTWMASSSGQFGWPAGVTSRPANKELVYLYLFFFFRRQHYLCEILAGSIDRNDLSHHQWQHLSGRDLHWSLRFTRYLQHYSTWT